MVIARYAHRPWGRLTVTYDIGPLQTLTDRYARYRTIPDHPGPTRLGVEHVDTRVCTLRPLTHVFAHVYTLHNAPLTPIANHISREIGPDCLI